MSDRITQLTHLLRQHELAALAVVPGANLRYLTGLPMHASKRLTIAFFNAAGEAALVVPTFEVGGVEAHTRIPLTIYSWGDAEGPAAALERCTHDLGLAGARLAVEHTTMRVFELRAIERAAPASRIEDAAPILDSMRMTKDAEELAWMREAVRIVEASMRTAIEHIRAGITERQLADIWERELRALGGQPSFDLMVGSGPNGANPHHVNSDRPLQPGDLIVLDGGSFYNGYASDLTRTVALGEPPAEARRIYELVQAANAAARAAVRPGATGEEIDRAARTLIEQAGYGPQFLHRTGHGLGIEIHEPPFIVGGSRDPLPVGATFTIEPGIYLSGFAGVRIEDDMLVTADGGESLTSFERDLIVVPATN